MISRWTDEGAREAVQRWGDSHGEAFALRLYTARLIGQDADLVLHGGGNVSLKGEVTTLLGDRLAVVYVKGSGVDLADIGPDGLPGLDLAHLQRFRTLDALTDAAMVNEIRTHMLDASAPQPSIETLLHAFLPQGFVDHSHADAVLTLTNQVDGESLVREALGRRVAIVPYTKPGFDLAKLCADAYEADPSIEGIVLMQHGLVTFGDDARTSYDRHIALVDACEQFAAARANGGSPTVSFRTDEAPNTLAARVAPLLRGLLAEPTGDEDQPHRRPILTWRSNEAIQAFVNSQEAAVLAAAGPLTSDHVIRTKPKPLHFPEPNWSDREALVRQLAEAVEAYRQDYSTYVREHGGSTAGLDASPNVVLLPGAGLFGRGSTKRDADIAADITEHTIAVKTRIHAMGSYAPLAGNHVFDMEHRALQRRKLRAGPIQPLAGHVVVISGGAGAIGAAVADVCAASGAHVAVTDVDERRLARVLSGLAGRHGPDRCMSTVMDVTDANQVKAGYEAIVRTFGGVDVIVPNAGVAHVSPIDELRVEEFRRVMEINTTGYLLFMQEGIRILKQQGIGGSIVINASKNVFGPGKDFGAYSASKAAGHQLGKVAAIELAPHGIRVNMINADAIFGDTDDPSGLWQTVGPDRAKGRGLRTEDLPEYYRERNLLKARVYGHHVGRAVVFFASHATPTTGATLPIDGGVVAAFPR